MSAAVKREFTARELIGQLEQRVEKRKKLTALQRAEQAWKSPVVVWEKTDDEQRKLLELAWRRGNLSYKLTPSQLDAYRSIEEWEANSSFGDIFGLDSSRRWGKSWLFLVKACEIAIRRKASRIVYSAETKIDVKKIVLPLMSMVLDDCPPHLRPAYTKSDMTFRFPNGSWIELNGFDEDPDSARGTFVDAVFLDECGFYANLQYLAFSVLHPQMLGRALARMYCASTPSKTPGHFWSNDMVPDAILRGAHLKRTLLDADQYTDEEKLAFMDKCKPGGRYGTTCLREYFCEHIADEELAILVEFRESEPFVVTDDFVIPQWRDCYTILDPGFNDLAAVLFAYWDFQQARIVVEDEFARSRENSRAIADGIKRKERELWKDSLRRGPGYTLVPQPFMRFSDNDPRLIADLYTEHQLRFAGVVKDKSLELMVNAVRVALSERPPKIIIHPRCVKLIAHCRNGIWKSKTSARLQFDRPGGEFGHYDLISCLVYLELSVHKRRNPMPFFEKVVRGDIKLKGKYERPGEAEGGLGQRSQWSASSRGAGWRRGLGLGTWGRGRGNVVPIASARSSGSAAGARRAEEEPDDR